MLERIFDFLAHQVAFTVANNLVDDVGHHLMIVVAADWADP
jgi:hypothetical protein